MDNDLLKKNLHTAFEIVLRLQNGLGWICRFQRSIYLPIEGAAVTPLVRVCELQQSLGASGRTPYLVTRRHVRLGVRDANVRIQAGFRPG